MRNKCKDTSMRFSCLKIIKYVFISFAQEYSNILHHQLHHDIILLTVATKI